jgi:hypothetical protein
MNEDGNCSPIGGEVRMVVKRNSTPPHPFNMAIRTH